MATSFEFTQIGVARTPLLHRRDAPCQPELQRSVEGTIMVHEPYWSCLEDIGGFSRIWLLYIFDRNQGWRAMVKPPRGGPKRGLFATRSPHRPSPIGMTSVELMGVEKDRIFVKGLDLLDQTPIVDIKPYLVFQDAHPDAKMGWVAEVGTEKLRNLDEEDEKGRRLREKRNRK